MRFYTRLVLLFLLPVSVMAQQRISGTVADAAGVPLAQVAVQNIHSGEALLSDVQGHFAVAVRAGQLIEFRRIGYKTARVRIGAGTLPPFYRILLEPGVQELQEVEVRNHFTDFKHDSLRYRALFKKQLEYQTVTGWRAFQSPFSALSKTNQQMIRFQEQYAWLEEQKFVDFNFNERLIGQLTGLRGDSATAYMRRFRPSYDMVRGMQQYDYFSYIKQTADLWRRRQKMGPSNGRGSGSGG